MEGTSATKSDKKSKPSFWHRLTGQSRKRNLKDKTAPPQEITLTRADKIHSSLRYPPARDIRKASSDIAGGSTSDQDLYRTLDSTGMADVHNDAGILFLNDNVLRLKSEAPKAPERHVQFAPTPLNKYYYDWEPRKDNNPVRKSLLPDKENVHPSGNITGSRSILRNRESGDFSKKNPDTSTKTVRTNQETAKLLKVRQMIIEARVKQTPSFPRTSTRVELKNNQNVPSPNFNESVVLAGHVEDTKNKVGDLCLKFEHQHIDEKKQNDIVRLEACQSSLYSREGNKTKREATEAGPFKDKFNTNVDHLLNRNPQNMVPFRNDFYRDKPDIQTASKRRVSMCNVGTSRTDSNHEFCARPKPSANGVTGIVGHQRSKAVVLRGMLKDKPPDTTQSCTRDITLNALSKQSKIVTLNSQMKVNVPARCSVQSINSHPYSMTNNANVQEVPQDNVLSERIISNAHNTVNPSCGLRLTTQNGDAFKREVWVDKKPDQTALLQNVPCPIYVPPQRLNQACGVAPLPSAAITEHGYVPHKAITINEIQNIPPVTNLAVEVMNRKVNKANENCRRNNGERKGNIITSSPCNPQGKTLPKSWRYQRSAKRNDDGMSSMADDECSLNCSCTSCIHRFATHAFPPERVGSIRQLEFQRNYFFPHIPNVNSISADRKNSLGEHEDKNDVAICTRKDGERSLEENRGEVCFKAATDQNQETQTDIDPPPTTMWYELDETSCKSPISNPQNITGNQNSKPFSSIPSENENIYSNESLSKVIEKAVRETLERLIASNTAPMLRTPHKSKSLEYMNDSVKNSQLPIYMNLEVYRSRGDGSSAVSATFSSENTNASVTNRSPLKCSVVLPSDAPKFDFSPSQLTVLQQTFQKLLLECGALNRKQTCFTSSCENMKEVQNADQNKKQLVGFSEEKNVDEDHESLAPERDDLKDHNKPQRGAPVSEGITVYNKENYTNQKDETDTEDQCLSIGSSSEDKISCDYQRLCITEVGTNSENERHIKGDTLTVTQSQSLPDLPRSIQESKVTGHSRSTVSLVHCCGPVEEAIKNPLRNYGGADSDDQKRNIFGNDLPPDNDSLPSRHSPDGWDKTPTTDNSSAYSTASNSSCSSLKHEANNDISGSTEKDLELLEEVKRVGMGLLAAPKVKKSPVRFRSPTKITKFKAKDVLSGKAKLKVGIYHNSGLVTVHVMRAAKLTSSHAKILNPYVKVSLMPDETRRTHWRTTVVKGQKNPVFDEKFSFEIVPDDSCKRLVFSIWHRDYTNQRSELLGCMSFGLYHVLDTSQCINGWYRLLREAVGTQKHFAAHPKKNRFLVQKTGFLGIVSSPCLV